MKISTFLKSSLIALCPLFIYFPGAFAEVRCGARWDGTPRCENWLGQEVDIKYRTSILGSTDYIEGTYAGKDFKQECTNFFGSYRCKSN